MTAEKGALKIKLDAGGSGDNVIPQGYYNSNEQIITDSFEASTLVATSTIEMGELPVGAKVVSIDVTHDALGTGVTIAIGDAVSAGRYKAATAAATAGTVGDILADGVAYQIIETTKTPLITIGTASATGTIKWVIRYTK